ncbi:YggN family protein [Frateuria aurantia]
MKPMSLPSTLAASLLMSIGVLVAACSEHDGATPHDGSSPAVTGSTTSLAHGRIVHTDDSGFSLDDHGLRLRAAGRPDAYISADGDFSIGNRPVPLSASQQQLFRSLYQAAMHMVDAGVATGKAGAMAGADITAAVLKEVFNGNADDATVRATVQQHLQGVSESVGRICDQLNVMQQQQDTMAQQVPAFQPYARIGTDDMSDCRQAQRDVQHAD